MSIGATAIAQGLFMIGAANAAPLVCKWVLGERFVQPIDGGLVLRDGRPLLGRSKTWRGLIVAIVASTGAAALCGVDWRLGAVVGVLAMAGDCLSSFTKRRLGIEVSGFALGLDQVPESLLPALACGLYLPLGFIEVAAIVLLFFAGELIASRLLYAVGLRDRPY